MQDHQRIQTILFYGLTTIMIVLSVYCLISAFSWINRPFAGFLTYEWPHVGPMSNQEWPGSKAGLGLLDRVVAVDDRAIWNSRDLSAIVAEKKPGTPVEYSIESKGQTQKVSLPVDRFTLKDFFLVFSITYLGGLLLYALGIIVYVLKPNTRVSWVFFILCFCLGTYMVTGFDILTGYFTVHYHYLVMCLFPPAFVHLGLIFPEEKRILNRFPRFVYLIYLPAVVLGLAYQIYLFNFEKILSENFLAWLPTYKSIGITNRFYLMLCVAGLIGIVFHTTWRASSSLARRRAGMILFGVSIAFLPTALIMLVMGLMEVNFPWNFLVFFVLFFPASIAYSIVKHNLFDADVIIKRTVGYVVVTAVIVGAYALVSVFFNVFLGTYQLAQSRVFPVLFTLGIILVFNPLQDRIQAIVDKVFFRKEYDYGEIIDNISAAITSLMDLDQILNRLTRTFVNDMFINTTSVMLLRPDGSAYQVYLADGENQHDVEQVVIRRNEPVVEIIEKEKKELTKIDVLEDHSYRDISESCAKNFEALHASLMVPLIFQDKVIGLLNLGEKKSGKFYNRADLDLLHTVSNQGAVAIENARLFQENLEKQRMEEELSIARDLQMSMLPAACPRIRGFQIAASSTPAQEVGGDFYDFIEMSQGKAGMIIGDVTSKSVSGALVMSASRSVFRMLSEEDLTVSESMARANLRLKKDVKSGMFVALLFAVLNPHSRTLTLCSAGQTQRVLLSAKTGQASLVETEGDTFPLGILEEVEYQDTRRQLEPGDKVVFYTDGIVEAMNDKAEMFGFERLLSVVQEATSLDADQLLEEIISRVNQFAGDALQHDDLTIIVINVTDEK